MSTSSGFECRLDTEDGVVGEAVVHAGALAELSANSDGWEFISSLLEYWAADLNMWPSDAMKQIALLSGRGLFSLADGLLGVVNAEYGDAYIVVTRRATHLVQHGSNWEAADLPRIRTIKAPSNRLGLFASNFRPASPASIYYWQTVAMERDARRRGLVEKWMVSNAATSWPPDGEYEWLLSDVEMRDTADGSTLELLPTKVHFAAGLGRRIGPVTPALLEEVASLPQWFSLLPPGEGWTNKWGLDLGMLATVLASWRLVDEETAAAAPTVAFEPRLIRSSIDAELAARDWLRASGYHDAEVTAAGADGGVDVRSSRAVAQVKAEMVPTGRPVIQQLTGVAAVEGKTAYCFSLAGYTPEAIEWARKAGVTLLRFDLQGIPAPVG